MRIHYLWIESFKNLRDFTITFGSAATTVLVGPNGSGKSNLFEALTLIFRALDSNAAPHFRYVLRYSCKGQEIEIHANPTEKEQPYYIAVDGITVTPSSFLRRASRYLPTNLFAYYSGLNSTLSKLFELSTRSSRRRLRKRANDEPLRRLFYASPAHMKLVMLAFLDIRDEDAAQFLRDHIGITNIDSILFVLRPPPPHKRRSSDPRGWGLEGQVGTFITNLTKHAMGPVSVPDPAEPLRRYQNPRNAYFYLPNHAALQALLDEYPNKKSFFTAIEGAHAAGLIDELRIHFYAVGCTEPLRFDQLSEGEQQLLTVLGLLRFTRDRDSLFLLDEPDTHLNPRWAMRYVEFLAQIMGDEPSTQVLMATHNPLVVTGMTREQVRIFDRPSASAVQVGIPEEAPRGMGVAGVLTSDLFGLSSTLDRATLNLLHRKRQLAHLPHLAEEERAELQKLDRELADLDMTRVARDPLYKPFVDAMAQLDLESGIVEASAVTPEEVRRRREHALRILRTLRAQEEEGE